MSFLYTTVETNVDVTSGDAAYCQITIDPVSLLTRLSVCVYLTTLREVDEAGTVRDVLVG